MRGFPEQSSTVNAHEADAKGHLFDVPVVPGLRMTKLG
jgi:hypothetical protein